MQYPIVYEATPSERNMAALAHGSILLTFVVGVTTGGIGTLLTVLAPLLIWFLYRERSEYVAFHALQATLFQLGVLLATLALTIVLGLGLVIVWVITGLLSIVLVGLLLVPVAIVLSILAGGILAIFPLITLGYGLVGAWQIFNGVDFQYRWVADWLGSRL